MSTARSLVAALALGFTAISCSDKAPTEANNLNNQNPTATARAARGPLVIPNVNQTFTSALGTATVNTVTITQFTRNATTGVVSAVGTLTGTFTNAAGVPSAFTQGFTAPITSLLRQGRRCRILFLDLGPLFLDVLGLQIDLSRITLDITAVAGPGNLLGNLLCAVAHLLDRNPLAGGIQTLLDRINAILAGV